MHDEEETADVSVMTRILEKWKRLAVAIAFFGAAGVLCVRTYDTVIASAEAIGDLERRLSVVEGDAAKIGDMKQAVDAMGRVIGRMQSDVALICLEVTKDISKCRTSTGRDDQ